MSITALTPKKTYDDYALLPEGAPYELIHGELVMSPAPRLRHQRVSMRLGSLLWEHLSRLGSGEAFAAPVDVRLSPHDVVQPDIAVVLADRLDILTEQLIDGAPDLVVEILSASTVDRDRVVKYRLYEAHGVREYWVIDPDAERVEIHVHRDGAFQNIVRQSRHGIVESVVLEGFRLDIALLFAT